MGAMSVSGAAASRIDLRRGIARLRRTRRGSAGLYVAAVGSLAAAYYLAGKVGLELAYLDGAVAALWPPAGLGLAVLFLGGGRAWAGVVIRGLFVGGFSAPLPPPLAPAGGDNPGPPPAPAPPPP